VDERQKHISQVHESGENKIKCVYCRKLIGIKSSNWHMKHYHKNEAIRCFKRLCGAYFYTEEKRRKHVEEIHESQEKEQQCLYCGKTYRNVAVLNVHMHNVHSSIKIKCKSYGCYMYFHSQFEHDLHFEEVHGEKENLKKYEWQKILFHK